ncbi:replication initiation protein [Francisella hispaniensis]|uniref:Initiator Rep protein WH1 domain-containing protein n=1 Tax=Francisella hispaniensis FSC454 TaxID=1088883 RepID=A0AAC9J6T5_9GAMM|nr:replication initiation protein [Francisella hispaniensis]APD51335.1 hypothetical protein FSC454_09325 [Francisella hispaniensis FSC454]KYW82780.1 hypothetical protein AUF42_07260 [Francisella hispaniensis FSC454]
MNDKSFNDIVSKTFYLTSLFADIKSEHNWTAYEIKTIMLFFSKLEKYSVYLPDKDLDNLELEKYIEKTPKSFTFKKEDFIFITGVRKEHLSREINKIRKSLISKAIHIPHPLYPEDEKSGISVTWFNLIEYNNSAGELKLYANPTALPRLLAFVKYAKVSFESIARLKNSYSIFTYLSLKIIKDSSYKQSETSFIISINEYKAKMGISNKYKMVRQFREFVLDVISKEINNSTEFNFSYELIKEGRSFNKIRFDFDYKDKPLITNQTDNNDEGNLFGFNISDINEESYFETILTSWGIRAKKVVEIEESYSINAINEAIEVTKQAVDIGIIKTTPAAFFLGTLENKELESQVEFKRQQQMITTQQEKEKQKQLFAEYEAIEKFINDNADELSNYLSIRSGGGFFELSESVKEELEKLCYVDIKKYKDFKSNFAVLNQGFWDMKQRKEVRPNMYNFLALIIKYQINNLIIM